MNEQPLDRVIAKTLRMFPDFPSPGVAFQDLCPVLAQPVLVHRLAEAMISRAGDAFDRVVAVEARGFVLGAVVAQLSERPLILARKRGKLPGPVHTVEYALEYGTASLQIQEDALEVGDCVLVVDDVLATGGTLAAAGELVARAGASVGGFAVALRIAGLGGTERLAPRRVFSVLTV